MPLQKLSSTDAFVVTDLPDAPASGVVRVARKILQGGAKDMARSATYTFAAFEMKRSGASAGINAEGDAVADAVAAFAEELNPVVEAGELDLDPAKGVPEGGLARLLDASDRHADGGSPAATVTSVMASVGWVLDGLDGAKVAVEGGGPVAGAVREALTGAGAQIVEVDGVDKKPWMIWGADADAIVCGSKLGTLTHQGTEFVKAKAIVPWGPTPVTTKAFAQLRRADIEVLPDFITAGGALLAGYHDDGAASISDAVVARLDALKGHADGLLLNACYEAEAFLKTWTDVPFGRPLAG